LVTERSAPVTFVLGGARSGKSRHAEGLVTAMPGPWHYIATAQALDAEMRARIRTHQAQRGTGWITVEAPLDLASALAAASDRPMLVDCLTLWLTNLMLAGHNLKVATAALDAALDSRLATTVLVANEVGLGIVPDNGLARAFRDAAGQLNQHVAARATTVIFMVAGVALRLK
jgi:adenosyl cobinamide kinase/adenosyl cobinamide phosphate guanylyltransferase